MNKKEPGEDKKKEWSRKKEKVLPVEIKWRLLPVTVVIKLAKKKSISERQVFKKVTSKKKRLRRKRRKKKGKAKKSWEGP